jgi:hypothetical protein
MLLGTEHTKRPWLNNVLVVLAVLGVFATFDIIGHKDTQYFWASLSPFLHFQRDAYSSQGSGRCSIRFRRPSQHCLPYVQWQ